MRTCETFPHAQIDVYVTPSLNPFPAGQGLTIDLTVSKEVVSHLRNVNILSV